MTVLVESLKRMKLPPIDGAWATIALILAALAIFAPAQLPQSIIFMLDAIASTAPYILFAVLAVSYLKASGAESNVAKAFEGRQVRMIVLAALMGGLSPFCSCQVIPFIAGLLALGTPIAPVMAFWLSSPLMDPAAFAITAGALGFQFAVAKTVAAVALGLFGGFAMYAATSAGWFADVLRPRQSGGCCAGPSPFKGKPVWKFWNEEERRQVFFKETLINAHFLFKWLSLAYLIESLMLVYMPAEAIAGILGGNGLMPIVLSALVGAPAYLNGYAAPPLVSGLMQQGMSPGAAMAFVVAGGVSCIPAMTAVFALVKRQVFAAYVAFGFVGAVLAGMVYGLLAAA
jgi:uncharacterized membrane protein YraQ (UPF0718 family)